MPPIAVLRLWIAQYGVRGAVLCIRLERGLQSGAHAQARNELRGEEPLGHAVRTHVRAGWALALGAHSPQAKGRVERRNGVHQGPLGVNKELRRKENLRLRHRNAYLEDEYLRH